MIHWSKEELELLKSNKSNEEIQELTGRSAIAIRSKRYKYTGHYVGENEWREDYIVAPAYMSHSEKLRRIYALAFQMKVKLKGE